MRRDQVEENGRLREKGINGTQNIAMGLIENGRGKVGIGLGFLSLSSLKEILRLPSLF